MCFMRCLQILTKALLPLPEKWHGLSDPEKRYRQRYPFCRIDLPSSSASRLHASTSLSC